MRDQGSNAAEVRRDEEPVTEAATGVHRRPDPSELAALVQPRPLALCGHCEATRAFARGLCRSCYRKFKDAGLPLPPRRNRWQGSRAPRAVDFDGLVAWIRALPGDVRAQMLLALREAP